MTEIERMFNDAMALLNINNGNLLRHNDDLCRHRIVILLEIVNDTAPWRWQMKQKKIPDDELWRCTCCCCWCCCCWCCCWWCCCCCWKSCLGSSLSARPPSLTSFDSSDSDSKLSSFLLDSKLSSFLLLALATFFCWRLNSCSDSRLQKRKWKVMPVIRRGSNFLVSNKFILELSTYKTFLKIGELWA